MLGRQQHSSTSTRCRFFQLKSTAEVEDVWFNALTEIDQVHTKINYSSTTDYVIKYWEEQNRNL